MSPEVAGAWIGGNIDTTAAAATVVNVVVALALALALFSGFAVS
ncbi:hypothetical protein AB0L44_16920 [Nonomuraea wenchangensis]